MENDALASTLACGYNFSSAVAIGWWNLTGTTQSGAMFAEELITWFDWIPSADTPLGWFGDVIGFFTGLPSFHEMAANGTWVPAVPGDVPW